MSKQSPATATFAATDVDVTRAAVATKALGFDVSPVTAAAVRHDVASARKDARLARALSPLFDALVTSLADTHKRADMVKTAMVAFGVFEQDGIQREGGQRTEYGNVVAKFGARVDTAIKRTKANDGEGTEGTEGTETPDYLALAVQAAATALAEVDGLDVDTLLAAITAGVAPVESVDAA